MAETGARLGDAIDRDEATGLLQAVDGRGANFTFACLWAQQRPSRFSVNWPLTARCQSAKRCASRGLARVVFRFVEGGTVPTSVAGTPRGFGGKSHHGHGGYRGLIVSSPRFPQGAFPNPSQNNRLALSSSPIDCYFDFGIHFVFAAITYATSTIVYPSLF